VYFGISITVYQWLPPKKESSLLFAQKIMAVNAILEVLHEFLRKGDEEEAKR